MTRRPDEDPSDDHAGDRLRQFEQERGLDQDDDADAEPDEGAEHEAGDPED